MISIEICVALQVAAHLLHYFVCASLVETQSLSET